MDAAWMQAKLDLSGENSWNRKNMPNKEVHKQYVKLIKVDETHFSVTAKVEVSDQFFGWILGFGIF